jgi:phospholipid/cholesterol/gamma-HCH transport system ATP-binding protein
LGLTSVIVSHDVDETAAISDYVYVLAGGRVVAQGSPQDLRESDSGWAQQFLGGLADGPVPFHYPAPDYAQDLMAGANSVGQRG